MKRTVMQTKYFLCVGPGGMKCSCCFPPRRTKLRKLKFRSAKRKANIEAIHFEFKANK
jgi:hypothetical protein